MSISSTPTKIKYTGNNSSSTPYPITFKYFDSNHVTVYADGVEISSGGLDICTFSGDGTANTGQFVTLVIYPPTATITVVLDVPFDQPVVLQETGSLPAKTIEVEGFDRLNMQIRRVWRKVLNDVLTFSNDEGGAGSTGTADNLIGFDGSGDIAEIPNSTFLQQDNNLSELANAPDQAAAQTNLNVDPAGTDNSTDVTKTGAGTYVSLAGQVLTVDAIEASDVIDFDTEVANNTTVAANTSDRHVAATKSGTGTYVSLNVQDIIVDPIQDGDVDSEASTSGEVLKSDGASGAAWAKVEGTEVASTGEIAGDSFLRENGDGTCSWVALSGLGLGNALVENPLSQFAQTTSLQLKNTILDETGTGALVFADNPVIDLSSATRSTSTANTLLGSVAGGTVEEIACTSAGRDLLDDANAADQRSTLGLVIGTDVPAWNGVGDSVTGSITYTSGTNSIALTGVGSLSGLAVGDIVEVTGTANNDNTYTVETITGANEIKVNELHAGKSYGKSLTTETVLSTVTLVCKANNAPAGYGNDWVIGMQASDRQIGTGGVPVLYTNSTGRPLHVITTLYMGASATAPSEVEWRVGGRLICKTGIDLPSSNGRHMPTSFIVPDGSTYGGSVGLLGQSPTLQLWSELR